MNKNFPFLLAAVISASAVVAQKPVQSEPDEDGMRLHLKPSNNRMSVFRGTTPSATEVQPAPAGNRESGPTEIDALISAFDQKTNLAVFIGDVVVNDPQFHLWCDKLTAHLKVADAAPTPTSGRPVVSNGTAPGKAKGGGLERAIAEMKPGRRVIITQDKPQPDGTIQHSVGTGERATYNANTGDIVLTGMPEVQQGKNRMSATSDHTKITLDREGHMKAEGTHTTFIVDKLAVGP